MNEPSDIKKAPPPAKRRFGLPSWLKPHTPLGWVFEAIVVVLLAGALILVAARYGPLTTEARLLIEAQLNGFQLGPYGKLKLEGVQGDVLRDVSVRKLTVTDPKGVWLEADNVEVRWRYGELLWRRLHIQQIAIGKVTVLRAPVLSPQPPPGKSPQFALQVDFINMRIETAPAFSQARGVYDLQARFDHELHGATVAALDLQSVLRRGDFMRVNVDLGAKDSLKLDATARELQGGGIAGSMGLDAAQPFTLDAHVTGTTAQGRLTVTSRSGGQTPIRADGAWNPNGASINAHLVLAQSRWTKGWADAAGPEADLALSAKRRDKTNYDVDARLSAANFNLTGRGPVDVTKQRSPGLAVSMVVNNLAKVVPQPVMGRGQASGVLSGALDDVHFVGQAQIADFEFLNYRLARAAGPVRFGFRKRELLLQAQATGYGAGGAGLIAEAGGPAPVGDITLDGLPDGRVLIKSMSLVGKGVKIDGAGGQNLFGGGLTFKGQMQAPDVAAFHPGGAGAVQASWSASQANTGGYPWSFTVEAHGDRFATGNDAFDRLVGAQPRLAGQAGFIGDTVSFDKLTLDGAKAGAQAQGQWKLDGAIKFAMTWQAEGPFMAGPLEMDGKAKGQGQLAGTWDAPKLQLASEFDTVAFPALTVKAAKLDLTFARTAAGGDGGFNLTGQSDYGPARIRSDFRFLPHGLELTGLDADAGGVKAHGELALRDATPSTADLTLAIAPGAVLTEGQAQGSLKVVAAPGGANAALNIQAKNAVLRGYPLALSAAKLTAQGPLAKLPYQLSADGVMARTPLKINGQGVFNLDPTGYAVAFEGSGQVRRSDFHTLEPAQLRLEDNDHYARLRLALGGGRAELDAREASGATNVKAVMTGVDLSFISEDFTGQFDANLELAGRAKDLHGTLDAALKNAHSRDARPGLSIDGQLKAALADGKLTVNSNLSGDAGLTSSANFVLPAEASAAPFRIALVRDRPMQGHFEANGEIQPMWDLFLGGERSLGGKLAAQADFAGTLADPKVTGHAELTGGRLDDYPTGLKLRDATIGAALNTDTISVETFKATDGLKGQVSGSGQVSLARGGGSSLLLKLNDFRLVDNDTATADATGDATIVRGTDGKAKITGALQIVRGDINAAAKTGSDIPTMQVVEKNRPFSLQDQLAPPPVTQPGVALDVTLTAARGLLVKGRGLNVDMSLDARVTGTSSKPILSGVARVVQGQYDFGGQRFTFDDRGVVYLSDDPNAIRLDLTATREAQTLTAVINIQGTAAKPRITLSSTPMLPNDEVLSQVLFGASASQLSPLEAAQLASALTALAGGGGFDVIGGLRSFARLDRLALVGGGAEGFSVAGGKYLGDNVYVELAGGGRSGPTAEVEYKITRSLFLVSRLANQPSATTNTTPGTVVQTGSSLSIRWRQDFRDKAAK